MNVKYVIGMRLRNMMDVTGIVTEGIKRYEGRDLRGNVAGGMTVHMRG